MSEKLDNNYNSIEDNYGFLTKNGPRPIGSLNLNNAINYFIKEFSGLGYEPIIHDYPTLFWDFKNIELNLNNSRIPVIPNPFSPSCDVVAPIIFISSLGLLRIISKNRSNPA